MNHRGRRFSTAQAVSTTQGYMFFAEDGQSGQAAELKDGKLGEFYKVSKLT
jgi:hypothetical protein